MRDYMPGAHSDKIRCKNGQYLIRIRKSRGVSDANPYPFGVISVSVSVSVRSSDKKSDVNGYNAYYSTQTKLTDTKRTCCGRQSRNQMPELGFLGDSTPKRVCQTSSFSLACRSYLTSSTF